MKRSLPAIIALCILFVWGAYAIGTAILAAYDPDDPLAYLAVPRLVILAIAGVLATGLLLRHLRAADFRRSAAEAAALLLATFGVLQVWTLSFAPAPYRMIDFAGTTFAAPIGYGAQVRTADGGAQTLSFQACMPALTPYYDNPLCDSRGVTLTTQPLLDGAWAQKVLAAAGAQGAGDTIPVPGQMEVAATGYTFTDGTRKTVFATDAVSGQVTSVMTCDSTAAELCNFAVPLIGNQVVLVQLPSDSTDLPDAVARFAAIPSDWRCPDAPGCVNKD